MSKRLHPKSAVPPPSQKAEHQAFLIYAMFPQITLEKISEMVGENPNTVRAWKFRRNWDKGLEEIRAMAKAPEPKNEPHVLAVVETREALAKEYEGDLQAAAKKFGKHMATMPAADIVEDAPKLDAADKMFGRRLKLDEAEQAGQGGHISLTFLGQAAEGSVRIIEQHPKQVSDKESAA